jgi:exonuclease III
MDLVNHSYRIMTWNVRGLNSKVRQENLRHIINIHRPDVVCIQETKMTVINPLTVRNALGADFESNFVFLPGQGTRGGILLATKDGHMHLLNPSLTCNTISATVQDSRLNVLWMITGVYGPQGEFDKKMFIRELRLLKMSALPRWLLLADFNLIYQDADKSNGRLNRRLMLRFRCALNHLEVKEVNLIGRKFTWSNSQSNPTLTRIDRVFCTPQWEEIFQNPVMQPLSLVVSDHCPLLVTPIWFPKTKPFFRFERFWTQMNGSLDCVSKAWSKSVPTNHNVLASLHIKLGRTSKALKAWSKSLMS